MCSMAPTKFSLVLFIEELFLGLGLCLKALIISIGKANIPTPPNKTTNIQPKNDKIAIM